MEQTPGDPSGLDAHRDSSRDRTQPTGLPTSDRWKVGSTGGAVAGAGIQFAVAILLFLFIGQWLDRRLGWAPWGTLAGVFIGAGAGFTSIYRVLMADLRREEAAKRKP